jgi:hypothetical protein
METPNSSLPEPALRRLNKDEQAFWREAFVGAELPVLMRGAARKVSAIGVAHLAAEYADAAVIEFRRRIR